MIFLVGLAIVVWILLVTGFAVHPIFGVASRGFVVAGMICSVLALLFFLRPDEELEAGEDPGSYLHAAYAFSDHQRVFFDDPALAMIPSDERALFRYGHAGFRATKDAVLWRDQLEDARVRPHFFAAYSILLAFAARLFGTYAPFVVSPLLAICVGWILGVWTWRMTGNRLTSLLAALLYWLHPVITWNARALRAEWPASLLVLGGISLWGACRSEKSGACRIQPFLAGFSIAGASLFHVTALYVLLPVLFVSLATPLKKGARAYFWGGILAGVSLLSLQVSFVSDPYGILGQLQMPGRNILFTCLVALFVLVPWLGGMAWRRYLDASPLGSDSFLRFSGFLLGWMIVGSILILMRFRQDDGVIPFLPSWTANYLSLTDFVGVTRMMSRLWFGISIVGIPLLLSGKRQADNTVRLLILVLLPAFLSIGWTDNYMFETRRMLTFLVPVLVVSTMALVFWGACSIARVTDHVFPVKWSRSFFIILFVCVCVGLGMRGRLHLYTTWNHRGLHAFYRDVAQIASEKGDVLLAEYTQTAVPLERLSSLPLLPLAWGYRDDTEYRKAERSWFDLVSRRPDDRFLFVTPFKGVALPGLSLHPLGDYEVRTVRMDRARRSVPAGVSAFHRRLSMYRVSTSGEVSPYPYIRKMDGSRLGVDGAANHMRNRTIPVSGLSFEKERSLSFVLNAGRTILAFLIPAGGTADNLEVLTATDAPINMQHTVVSERWLLMDVDMSSDKEITLLWNGNGRAILTDVLPGAGEGGGWVATPSVADTETVSLRGLDAQWLRANSRIALPVGREQRLLLLLVTTGRDDDKRVALSVDARESVSLFSGWQWICIPLDVSDTEVFRWHDIAVMPAWDPQIRGFPEDLGLLVSTIIVM